MKSTSAFEINVNNGKFYLSLESLYLGPNGHDSLLTLRSDNAVPPDSIKKFSKLHRRSISKQYSRYRKGCVSKTTFKNILKG